MRLVAVAGNPSIRPCLDPGGKSLNYQKSTAPSVLIRRAIYGILSRYYKSTTPLVCLSRSGARRPDRSLTAAFSSRLAIATAVVLAVPFAHLIIAGAVALLVDFFAEPFTIGD